VSSEIILNIEGVEPMELYGEHNIKLTLLKNAFPDVTFTSRGSQLKLVGEKKDTQNAKSKVEMMVRILKSHKELTAQTVADLLAGENPFETKVPSHDSSAVLVHGREGKVIKAKTKNQKLLVESSDANDIVFAIGPAGTGKTYTAVALAVRALRNKTIKKIILTRPAVEAGESLGFLPGDMKEKVDPYLRPLYDALDDMIPLEKLNFFMTNRVIEIAPLAFMRGRTLDNSFIILDEAQNATSVQLKMFLTRLGPSAKCIITGDLTQIDLPFHQKSGLRLALNLLQDINGVGIVELSTEDVVRHRLVKAIIMAYDKHTEEQKQLREQEKQKETSQTTNIEKP
jgi:phosphate starvation-inducible PhoH-like protein